LNSDLIINDFSTDIPSLLGIESNEIFGKDFTEILEKESMSLWQTAKDKFLQDESYHTTLSLRFLTPKKLIVPAFCSISNLLKDGKIIVSSFSAIMEQTIENKNTVQEVFNEEEKGIYSYPDVQLIQSVYDFILMHKNTSFPTLKELARIFGTNEYKLKVGFRYLFKTSIYQFYNNERLKRSHLLIKHTKIPLKNIAIMVGFSTYPNFSRAFKIKFGCSPTEIIRKSS
jgi:AraC-like DNA-binding protein